MSTNADASLFPLPLPLPSLSPLSPTGIAILALLSSTLYLAILAVHRLCLSPVARFPGPRLAALTFWYECWFDVVKDGRYTWRIEEMHREYGPIVRINPYELHIKDPTYHPQIYVPASARRTNKWAWSAKMFGTTRAAVGTVSHDLHRLRRSALNPFFSRRSVARLESVIQADVDRLCGRLKAFADAGQAVSLSPAFAALSADVVGSFAFGKSYGFLGEEGLGEGWHCLMLDLSRATHLMKQFGWLYTILTLIPQRVVALVHPLTEQLFELQNGIARQIRDIKASHDGGVWIPKEAGTTAEQHEHNHDHPTILHDMLTDSNLPAAELSDVRLVEEAFTLVGAGTVTTAYTLATTVFHLLTNESSLRALRAELAAQWDRDPAPRWSDLEQLPYLSAVVSEGLRLSYGVSHRLPRISPDLPLRFKEWIIPAGTPVSMTQMFIHNDASLFPSPLSFLPERWLPGPEGEPPSAQKKYLVPFSRGARMCVGMNLAYAEIYLTLASLFKPMEAGGLDLKLFETDESDVTVVHDFFNPFPRLDSKGIRVLVRSNTET